MAPSVCLITFQIYSFIYFLKNMKKLLAAVLLAGMAFVACQKEYSIENGQVSLTGAWEFKDSVKTLYTGNAVQYLIDDTSNPASARMIYNGATANLSATISIEVYFPTGTATTGSYQSANGQVTFSYNFNNSGRVFQVNGFAGQFSTENMTVNITQISDTSVTGTFSGTALDSANKLVKINEGKFSYRKRSVATLPVTVSVGTLGSATDTCTGAVVSGIYKKNTALTGANTVTLSVNVTTAGTYTISSDTLKGISFKGTGSFTATGVQSVVIAGVGTPTDSAAALRFRVRYGTSSCTFLVKIDTAGAVIIVPPTGDYLPLTTNSNWSYSRYGNTGNLLDTFYIYSTGTTKSVGANAFNILLDPNNGDSTYYRKGGGLYYQAANLDDLIGTGGLQQTIILKDNVPNASSWADSFNVNYNGIPVKLKATYTITAKAVPATTTGGTYADVIKVNAVYNAIATGFPAFPIATIERWYAKGKGIVYEENTNTSISIPTSIRKVLTRSVIF